jgi:hypothetical protein
MAEIVVLVAVSTIGEDSEDNEDSQAGCPRPTLQAIRNKMSYDLQANFG